MLRVGSGFPGAWLWSAPELHRGGGYYCVHIAACALCLSLDGSICPPGSVAPGRNRKRRSPVFPPRGGGEKRIAGNEGKDVSGE